MMRPVIAAVVALLMCFGAQAVASGKAKTDDSFGNKQTEQRFRKLVKDIRCMVCQNQTLLDSNAPLAVDLRREILKKIDEGKSDGEIIDFLVKRYGDFVLYNPPLKSSTVILWFGPAIFLLIGLAGVMVLIMRRRRVVDAGISDAERKRLDQLLSEDHREQ